MECSGGLPFFGQLVHDSYRLLFAWAEAGFGWTMIDEAKFIAAFREINEVEERSARNAYMMFDAVGHSEHRVIYFYETVAIQRLSLPADDSAANEVQRALPG